MSIMRQAVQDIMAKRELGHSWVACELWVAGYYKNEFITAEAVRQVKIWEGVE